MAKRRILITLFITALPALIVAGYVGSIMWRVSAAEEQFYGRSYLNPLGTNTRKYTDPPTAESFGSPTFKFKRGEKTVIVYKQLINSFQHTYGSALAALEIGSTAADALFRINEYIESSFCKTSGSQYFYLDTKKDLANNMVGRKVGKEAALKGLQGPSADRFISAQVLSKIDAQEVFASCDDPRVAALPSLSRLGCPFLEQIQSLRAGLQIKVGNQ